MYNCSMLNGSVTRFFIFSIVSRDAYYRLLSVCAMYEFTLSIILLTRFKLMDEYNEYMLEYKYTYISVSVDKA